MNKVLFSALLPLIMAAGGWAAEARNGFYVWRRAWSAQLAASLPADRPLWILAAEWDKSGLARIRLPAEARECGNATPVVRLHAGVWRQIAPAELAEFASSGRLQLDCDVPVSQLAVYAGWLAGVRAVLPGVELSVTVLPSHLASADFHKLAGQCDYFVLQLHGIEPPVNISEDYQIINRRTAFDAIGRAARSGKPFRLALPCYTYTLVFDAGTGKFSRLFAEAETGIGKNEIFRNAGLDISLIHDIISQYPELPVIWFRLPAENDISTLALSEIATLEQGGIPAEEVVFFWSRRSNCLELAVEGRGRIWRDRLRIALEFPVGATGEYQLYNGASTATPPAFGLLPDRVDFELKGCGRKTVIGRFYTEQPAEIRIANENNAETVAGSRGAAGADDTRPPRMRTVFSLVLPR